VRQVLVKRSKDGAFAGLRIADRSLTVVEYSESFVRLFGPLPEVVTREVTRGVVTMLTASIKGITDTGCLKFQILLLNGAVP